MQKIFRVVVKEFNFNHHNVKNQLNINTVTIQIPPVVL